MLERLIKVSKQKISTSSKFWTQKPHHKVEIMCEVRFYA